MTGSLLWVPFTLAGSAAQLFRNAAQASLTARIGTLGATQTRFVFGLPFAALYLAIVLRVTGAPLPHFGTSALGWTVLAALSQVAATAMMLVVMGRRAFGVAYAYIKTEPVIVALTGVMLLGDRLPWLAWVAVVMVTAGVLVASVRPEDWRRLLGEGGMILIGLVSGAFALGFQLAAPFLVFGFAVYAALGILAKLMPQLQVFFVAVPINILCGFVIMMALLGSMMTIFLNYYATAMSAFL